MGAYFFKGCLFSRGEGMLRGAYLHGCYVMSDGTVVGKRTS